MDPIWLSEWELETKVYQHIGLLVNVNKVAEEIKECYVHVPRKGVR